MTDPTFTKINIVFVFSFKNGNNDPERNPFDKHCIPLCETEHFNALIDNKPFFDQPVKNKQETCEKLVEMSRNDIQQEAYSFICIIKTIINSLT